MARHNRPLRARAAGFTLLELMVALTLGGIAITSIYAVGAASTRSFRAQQQVASAQSSLRIALGQVKRDIARAGFLATPNVQAGQSCGASLGTLDDPGGNGRLAAISRYDADFCNNAMNNCTNVAGVSSGGAATVTANRASGFTADAVVLVGNYETASEYPGVRLLPGGSSIAVGSTWHSFQTDFTEWQNGTVGVFNSTAFQTVFTENRMIRIRTTKGLHHFAQVTAVTDPGVSAGVAVDATITFNPAVPAGCANDIDGAWVAPVNAIRYFPRDNPSPDANRADTFGPMAQLVRQEVDPLAKQVPFSPDGDPDNALPPRVVLDYLVAFQLGFVLNGNTAANAPDSYAAGVVQGDVNATPERVRAVRILLAARTPEQDNTFNWTSGDCSNLRCFKVFNDRVGAARVRTVRTEVFVPNVAFEGY